jgi:hypothetical protein
MSRQNLLSQKTSSRLINPKYKNLNYVSMELTGSIDGVIVGLNVGKMVYYLLQGKYIC